MSSSRRDFFRHVAAGAAVAGTGAVSATAQDAADKEKPQVDRRTFGKIGADVSILGLGLGSAFTKPYDKDRESAHKLLLSALEKGINYWDTARPYQNSEEIIGPVLKQVRDRVFMVSKTGNRTYDGFKRDLEKSLTLLQTDHLDLYHLHNFVPKTDGKKLDAIEKGAVKAAREAKEQGIIKNFGVTGHSSADLLVDCIKRFKPDAVLTTFPCNRPDGGKYEDNLLPLARSLNMGVIAMKTVRQARNTDLKGTDLIRYAMSLEGVHVTIVGLDTQGHLDENALMATDFKPLPGKQRAEMTREAEEALAGLIAPWDVPGYTDGIPV